MTDQNDNNVDFKLKAIFERQQRENRIKMLTDQKVNLTDKNAELIIIADKLRDCAEQLKSLKLNLELYAIKVKELVGKLQDMEKHLKGR